MVKNFNPALSVNLNKVALVRNARPGNFPDVLEFAKIAIKEGAQGITMHPRPDFRHSRPEDLWVLKKNCPGELNIEGNPFHQTEGEYPGFLKLVLGVKPNQCTLVPDSHHQKTSDHGWNLKEDGKRLFPIVEQLKQEGIRVSIFMDPDYPNWQEVKNLGCDRVELYTESWAQKFQTAQENVCLAEFQKAAKALFDLGIEINAGHDLNLENLKPIAQLKGLKEVSIGHALMVDAWRMGFALAVRSYLAVLQA